MPEPHAEGRQTDPPQQEELRREVCHLEVRALPRSAGASPELGTPLEPGCVSLRSELRGLDAAINNSERASSVIATTEAYLTEVSDLLNSIKALVVEAANTGGVSEEEIAANQLQIDSAIDSITRISNTASFAGLQLLNGSLERWRVGSGGDDRRPCRRHRHRLVIST